MTVETAPLFPDDMYATKEDGLPAQPMPRAQRKTIAPFSFTKHQHRMPLPGPFVPEKLPDADLPLFTPQAPDVVVTAQGLIDTCGLYLPAHEEI